MNERIKELIGEANIHFSEHHQHSGVDTAVVVLSDMKKFAELIVRECGEYVGNKGMLAGGGCTVVGEEILMIVDGLHKYFGVKG